METDSAEQEHPSVKKLRLQGPTECIADLRQMVNNSTFSDIVIVCNDGKRVHALRKLLAGRSEVFKSLLLNGMTETTQSEIDLPEISSRALLSVFEFLYTGALLDYQPHSWKFACELILASRFFILPTLENVIRMFMHEQIFSVAEDKTEAASLLTEALEYGLCGEKDVSIAELVRILSSDWRDSVFVQNLSEDAFHYLLANSKGNCEVGDYLSLREYDRFMQVILWSFYKGDLGSYSKESFVNFIPEEENRALCLYDDPDNVETPSLFKELTLGQLQDAPKNCVMRLLSNIDCMRIHPILLATVVEPLNLIPSADIMNSFRFHAIEREFTRVSDAEYVWDNGEFCTLLESGAVIQRAADRTGLAVMKKTLSSSNTVWSCTFVIEEVCEGFVEVGLFHYSSEVGAERLEFDKKILSNQDHALVLKFQDLQVSAKVEGHSGQVEWELLGTYGPCRNAKRRVKFRFNGSEHNCSLSLGATDLGVKWENLPRRLYYPAVSFDGSGFGRVRVCQLCPSNS